MKHAGQRDANTYNNHYMPNNSGTDGQGSYFGTEVRSVVNDLFRGLTVARNPHLAQSLPAEKKEALHTSPKFVAIEEELISLRGQESKKSTSRRKQLYEKKRKLADQVLREWQKTQPCRPITVPGEKDPPCYHRSIFNRVRFLMPERDRLAENLFQTDTLRSSTGLQVLRDMIALCETDTEVKFRPGLEPDLCQCGKSTRRRKLPESSCAAKNLMSTYDWKHIYSCFKKSCSGFAELCFLCNEWVIGEEQWSDHCRSHPDCPETLPTYCDPLTYGGVLATAGYCVLCMAQSSLAPEVRLHQFLDRYSWRDHVYRHFQSYAQDVEDGKLASCPHPHRRCNTKLESAKQLEFHLLDVHCPEFIMESSILGVPKEDEDVTSPRKKRQLSVDTPASEMKTEAELQFIDQTTEIMQRHTSKIPSAPVLQGFISPILGCHDNALPEDEAAEDIEASSSQPLLTCDDSLQLTQLSLQVPTVSNAPELLSYTTLPELVPPSEINESTPSTVRSPEADVPHFDISEFITFSPSPEPEVSASYLAANNSKEMLIDDAIITTCDDPPARPDIGLLSLHRKEGRDIEDDHPHPSLQYSSQNSSLDEIVVGMPPLHHRTSPPKSQSESCITGQARQPRPLRIKLRTKGQGTTKEHLAGDKSGRTRKQRIRIIRSGTKRTSGCQEHHISNWWLTYCMVRGQK